MTTPHNHNTADQSGADERELSIAATLRRDANVLRRGDADNEIASNMIAAATVLDIFDRQRASNQPAPQAAQSIAITAHVFRGPHGYELSGRLPNDTPLNLGLNTLYAAPQPFPAPAVQSGDLYIAVSVFKSLFFNDGLEGESLDEQLRRAMRAAFISSGQAIAQTAPAVAGEAIRDAALEEAARTIETSSDCNQLLCQYHTQRIRALKTAAPSQGAKHNG